MSREYRDLLVKGALESDDEQKAVSFRGQRMSRAGRRSVATGADNPAARTPRQAGIRKRLSLAGVGMNKAAGKRAVALNKRRAKMTAPKKTRKPRAARHRQGAVVGSVFDVYGGGR